MNPAVSHAVALTAPAGLWRLSLLVAACGALYACGGGNESVSSASVDDGVASGVTTLVVDAQAVAVDHTVLARPTFHLAPVVLDAPSDADALNAQASATSAPMLTPVAEDLAGLSTQGLTLEVMEQVRAGTMSVPQRSGGSLQMMAGTAVVTYTPAQVRAAYGFPAVSGSAAALSSAQAAQWGAGQTIYVVAANHNPNAAAELAAFNQKFGLPTCSSRVLTASTALPLAAASASAKACELVVAYSTAAGGLSNAAPAYDAGWATEIALDVQWSHAMAPLARIVLIEAPDASVNSLLGAIRLANAMGPGVVSMSFGAGEGAWTSSVDSVFAGANMSYLAATGDWGAGVMWPSVSPNVLAVGGTTLTYSGSGARSEIAWSGTGGGTSAYIATPSYQKSGLPAVGTVARRTVADVAMNADPASGQYVAVMSGTTGALQWVSAGGTSLSTPQWAGLVAVANAVRGQAAKPVLGLSQVPLYGQIGANAGNYASAFLDVASGSHGTCAACTARTGYDQLTGLGTPQATNLVNLLAGAAAVVPAPVVASAAIAGTAGAPLTFTASATAPNPVAYTLSGAPSGMAISSTGVVTWASPVAGTYSVVVTAKDTITAKTGQGTYTVTIQAAKPPVIAGGTVSAKPGVALSFTVATTASNPVTYSLSGAPAGMVISAAGVVTWSNPLAGTYSVTVTAKDSKTGLTGSAVFSIQVSAAAGGLTITAAPMAGIAGKPLTGNITLSAPGAAWMSVAISGVPLGMGLALQGTTIVATWPSPVVGSYKLQVTLRDSLGRMVQATVPVTVTAN